MSYDRQRVPILNDFLIIILGTTTEKVFFACTGTEIT